MQLIFEQLRAGGDRSFGWQARPSAQAISRASMRSPGGAAQEDHLWGQTGADRAALDVGLDQGLDVGGWVPRGRTAEDGRIPDRYPGLVETDTRDPAVRTMWNVRDADATLIVSHGPLVGGSRLTLEEAHRQRKPALHLDLQSLARNAAAKQLRAWLTAVNPRVLNVAGPRRSEHSTIYMDVATLLRSALGIGSTRSEDA